MRLAGVLLATIILVVVLLLALVQKVPTSAPEERSEDHRLEAPDFSRGAAHWWMRYPLKHLRVSQY